VEAAKTRIAFSTKYANERSIVKIMQVAHKHHATNTTSHANTTSQLSFKSASAMLFIPVNAKKNAQSKAK
jgi:hypothetical protein